MSTASPIRLVVLFGGRSAEHDISRITARHVLAAADPDRYDLVWQTFQQRSNHLLQPPSATLAMEQLRSI